MFLYDSPNSRELYASSCCCTGNSTESGVTMGWVILAAYMREKRLRILPQPPAIGLPVAIIVFLEGRYNQN